MAPDKSSSYALLAPPTDGKTPNQHELVDHKDDPEHPANLIPMLCRNFYKLGWVTGTGGGISIRAGEKVYLAPSGVQKERISPEDIFVLTLNERAFLRWPVHKPLKQSACTPLFYNAYELRQAGACIHTHSQHAVMATLLWKGTEFRVSHQEMIKGMRIGGTGTALSYLDTLVIPIIENTPDEEDLREGMEEAMRKYPDAVSVDHLPAEATQAILIVFAPRPKPAVLVRRHGTYSWGADWEKAKAQAECLDYLLEVAVKMKLAGFETVGL